MKEYLKNNPEQIEKILSYYSDYQNTYIKHNDNIKENEIGLIINETNIIMQFLIKTLG